MPMQPETSGQCNVSMPSPGRLAIQMKVGSNTFQASGDRNDVWSAVEMFKRLVEPVTFSTHTVPWSIANGLGAASAQPGYWDAPSSPF